MLAKPPALAPTFVDCGSYFAPSPFLGRALKLKAPGSKFFRGPLRRFSGDMAVLGKGEIFVPGAPPSLCLSAVFSSIRG